MNGRKNTGKIVFAVVTVLILIIMSCLMVNSARSYITIQADIAHEKSALDQEQVRLDQLEKLSRQDKEITASIEASKKLIPAEPKEDELIKYLQDKAYGASTDFLQIMFEPRITGKQYVEMPVKISFKGKYTSLMDFLKLVHDGERAIRVDNVSVKTTSTDASEIIAELSASAFYMDNTAASGTGSTAGSGTTANTGNSAKAN